MDQIIAACEAVTKAKSQCDFLDRAKADALDRLKAAEAEHQHLMRKYVAYLGSADGHRADPAGGTEIEQQNELRYNNSVGKIKSNQNQNQNSNQND